MRAYKTHLTVKDPKRVVLTDLPFRAGQGIEVLILRADSSDNAVRDFEPLLKETQSLPQAQAISEADIALPSSVPQDAEVPPNIEAEQIISCFSAVLSD